MKLRFRYFSSSPEACSGFSQGPRSSPTTRMPASVSTFAAVAPPAPAPTMTTSTASGFFLVFMTCSFYVSFRLFCSLALFVCTEDAHLHGDSLDAVSADARERQQLGPQLGGNL